MWAWDTGWLGFDKGEEERGTFIHWSSVWGEDTGRRVLCRAESRLAGCLTDVWSGLSQQSRSGWSTSAWAPGEPRESRMRRRVFKCFIFYLALCWEIFKMG